VVPPPQPAAAPVNPWFVRPSFDVTAGTPDNQWKLTPYGFAELDLMNDSTRSFADVVNSNVLARDGTQAGTYGRTQMGIRNSRIGFKASAPTIGGIKSSGVIEADFLGYDPAPPTTTEAGFFNNPTFRVRLAYAKAESDVVDVLAGQNFHLFGWQTYFFPTSLLIMGLPNQVFGRTTQFRLSHTFKSDDVNFEIAAAAVRPAQRDSSVPDGEAGLRLSFNNWKAVTTQGSGATTALPAAIGVSALARRFKVDQFSATPSGNSTDTGWAVAGDVLVPIISAADKTDRMNKLTLTGEFSVGTGYADQFTGMTAGAGFPNPPDLASGGTYTPDIDNGMVTYDPTKNGVLHTIDWRTFVVGLQYYVDRFIFAGNYTQGDSDNMTDLFPKSAKVFKKSQSTDFSAFYELTPAMRVGLGYQYLRQQFCDDATAQNHRFEAIALYYF